LLGLGFGREFHGRQPTVNKGWAWVTWIMALSWTTSPIRRKHFPEAPETMTNVAHLIFSRCSKLLVNCKKREDAGHGLKRLPRISESVDLS